MSKLMFLLSGFFIFPATDLFADVKIIPREPFYQRYEKASDIVYGEITKIEGLERLPNEFSEFSIEDTKKATMLVIKSWKGQKAGKITFLFNSSKEPEDNLKLAKKRVPLLKLKDKYIFFLREIDGEKIAERNFGVGKVIPKGKPDLSHDHVALERLASGASMSDAVKEFGPPALQEYEEYLKAKK